MSCYKYPRFVDKNNITTITDRVNERRFLLRIKLKGAGEGSLLVIIKNMGAADEIDCDERVYRILKYVKLNEELQSIGEVMIMSIFPVCCCKTNYIIQKLYEKGPDFICGNDDLFQDEDKVLQNRYLLKKYILKADKIILAWGTPVRVLSKFFNESSDYILNIIKESRKINPLKQVYIVGEQNITGHPKSCMSWRYKDRLSSYNNL